MTQTIRRLLLVFTFLLLAVEPAMGAHFDIDAGRVVLRQLQYCTHCGSALLVTNVQPGVLVRCPDCGQEQTRIANEYILNQMYQLCKTCQGPLNPEGHKPGDMTNCENCRTRQVLNRDVFAVAKKQNGPGYAPGHPPGKEKKALLLAPNKPDAMLAMVPLDDEFGDLPVPADFIRKKIIPKPPEHFAAKEEDFFDATESRDGDADADDFGGGQRDMIITEEIRSRKNAPEGDADRDVLLITEQARRRAAASEQSPPPVAREQRGGPSPEMESGRQAGHPSQSRQRPQRDVAAVPAPFDPAAGASDAIEVPAVTADLFGGKRLAPAARDTGTFTAPGKIVAKVNGEPIYSRDVDRVIDPVMERLQARAGKDEMEVLAAREKELRREVLERLIDRELVVREAAAMGYVPDPVAIRNREGELAQIFTAPGINLRREAMRDITMSDMRKQFDRPGSAAPTTVREFYQSIKSQLVQPRRIALDQLVVYEDRSGQPDRRDYREVAMEITASLEHGAKFDDMRDRYDEFTRTAGIPHAEPVLQPESAYSRQILQAAGELRRGAVFGPLFLPGMALFGKVTDERKEGPAPFEEVEKEIRRKLEDEATEKKFGDWLKRLRSKARIEIGGQEK